MSEYHGIDNTDDDAIRSLWSAVLLRAMRDAIGLGDANLSGIGGRAARIGSRRWFSDAPVMYRLACDGAGVDPEATRDAALRIIDSGKPPTLSACQSRVELRHYIGAGRAA